MNNNNYDDTTRTGADNKNTEEPATSHDVTEGGVLGAVGGAVVGALAGGPIGAVIGAVAGGVASAGAVSVVDKHDNDYARTVGNDMDDDDATVNDHMRTNDTMATTRPAYQDTMDTTPSYQDTASTTAFPESTGYQDTTTTPRTNMMDTGMTDQDTMTTPRSNMMNRDMTDQTVIPVVEEELEVGKRQVQTGGAHIHTSVSETPVEEQVSLREESVQVERRPVNRPVTADDTAFNQQSFEVTETAEIPVVAKEARVVEEVAVGKTVTERNETIRDTVRRTDVDIEEVDDTDTFNRNSTGRGSTLS